MQYTVAYLHYMNMYKCIFAASVIFSLIVSSCAFTVNVIFSLSVSSCSCIPLANVLRASHVSVFPAARKNYSLAKLGPLFDNEKTMDGGAFYTRRSRDDNTAGFSPHYGGMSSGTSARHEDPKRHRVSSPSQDTIALNQKVDRVLALLET